MYMCIITLDRKKMIKMVIYTSEILVFFLYTMFLFFYVAYNVHVYNLQ